MSETNEFCPHCGGLMGWDGFGWGCMDRCEKSRVRAPEGVSGPEREKRIEALRRDLYYVCSNAFWHGGKAAEDKRPHLAAKESIDELCELAAVSGPEQGAAGGPTVDELARLIVRHVSAGDWAAMPDGVRDNYRNAVNALRAALRSAPPGSEP